MSRAALYRRRRELFVLAALLFLIGAVILIWLRISAEGRRADGLAAEADRRGTAVSTLAGDVRQLRAQLQAKGEKPVAPDPTAAVRNLPDRAAVPVPIPGPRGATGQPGRDGTDGRPGQDATGQPGKDGADGAPGVNGKDGEPGQDGINGMDGKDGVDGKDGQDGATGPQGERGPAGPAGPACPDGYSLQVPSWDPDALVCRRDGAPPPSTPDPTPSSQAMLLDRKRW